MQRIRIQFTKGEELRFTGHLDLHKIWERTFRRARLPLAYSQGFHPQPKIQLASALPLGFTSTSEWMDAWLDSDLAVDDIGQILSKTLQPGLTLNSIESVPLHATPLQNRAVSTIYRITLPPDVLYSTLEQRIDSMLSKSVLPRERRGKVYDLRPLIESAALNEEPDGLILQLQLSACPGATGRPEEVLEELGIDPLFVDVERTEILFSPEEGSLITHG